MATMGDFQPVRDEVTGELFIPASRRPDGTWRKARKVKEGYIPQEEVPVYESKGKQWAKSHSQYPVGMSPAMIAAQEAAKNKAANKNNKPLIPGLPPSTQQTTTKKKKKKGSNKPEGEVKTVTTKLAGFTIQEPTFGASAEKPKAPAAVATDSAPDPKQENTETTGTTSDPAKRLKNLKKKLRDIEALETRVKSGELKNPDKDQLEKIKRKKEVVKEIADLEKLVTA